MSEKVYSKQYKEVKIIIRKELTSVSNVWCNNSANVDLHINFYIIVQK